MENGTELELELSSTYSWCQAPGSFIAVASPPLTPVHLPSHWPPFFRAPWRQHLHSFSLHVRLKQHEAHGISPRGWVPWAAAWPARYSLASRSIFPASFFPPVSPFWPFWSMCRITCVTETSRTFPLPPQADCVYNPFSIRHCSPAIPYHHTGRLVMATGRTNKSSVEPLPLRKASLYLTVNVCSPNLPGVALPVPAGGEQKWVVPGLASWRRGGARNWGLRPGPRGAACVTGRLRSSGRDGDSAGGRLAPGPGVRSPLPRPSVLNGNYVRL